MAASVGTRKPIELDRLTAKAKLVAVGRYPEVVTFPDGSTIEVPNWKEMTLRIVSWVGEERGLPEMPFHGCDGATNYFLNSTPHHALRPMKRARTVKLSIRGEDVYIDTGRSAENLLRRLCALCQSVGLPASEIRVLISEERYPHWRR